MSSPAAAPPADPAAGRASRSKYGGRFDGTVTLADGRDFAAVMVATGHAVPMAS